MQTKLQAKLADIARTLTQYIVRVPDGAYQLMLIAKSRGTPGYSLLTNVAAEFLQSTCAVFVAAGNAIAFAGGGTRGSKGKVWRELLTDDSAENVAVSVLLSKIVPSKNTLAAALMLDNAFGKQSAAADYIEKMTGDADFAKAVVSLAAAQARFMRAVYELDTSLPETKSRGTPAVSWQDMLRRADNAKEDDNGE